MRCVCYDNTDCMNSEVLEENIKTNKSGKYYCCYECLIHEAIEHDKLQEQDNKGE